jgi:peptidoglycan hydrolase CwlO-like protein
MSDPRDLAILSLEKRLADAARELTALQAESARVVEIQRNRAEAGDAMVRELAAKLADAEAKIRDLEAGIAERDAEIARLDAAVTEAEHLAEMYRRP